MGVDHWFGSSGVLSNYQSAAPQGDSLAVTTAPYPSGDWGAWAVQSGSRGTPTAAYPSVANISPVSLIRIRLHVQEGHAELEITVPEPDHPSFRVPLWSSKAWHGTSS
jgi:hypothetical protein